MIPNDFGFLAQRTVKRPEPGTPLRPASAPGNANPEACPPSLPDNSKRGLSSPALRDNSKMGGAGRPSASPRERFWIDVPPMGWSAIRYLPGARIRRG